MPLRPIPSVILLAVVTSLPSVLSFDAFADARAGDAPELVVDNPKLAAELPAMTLPNVPLSEVLEFIKDISGIPVEVEWKALEQMGVKKDQQIDVNVRKVRTDEAVRIILLAAAGPDRLDYVLERGTLKVSTVEALALRKVDDPTPFERDLARKRKQVLSTPIQPSPWPIADLPQERRLRAQQLDNWTLANSIDFIRDICETNIIVRWPALAAAGVKPDTKLTARLPADASLSQWLDPLLSAVKTKEKHKLAYTFADGVVIISTKEEIDKIDAQPPMKHVR